MGEAKERKLRELRAMMDSVPSNADMFDASPVSRERRRVRKRHEGSVEEPHIPQRAANAAFQRIVDLCGYQDFSRAKMRARLRREKFPEDAVEEAIAKAVRIGLIDDLRWGEMRASALMRKGMGNAGIIRELKENGISASDIEGWPFAYEERFGDELERALRFLEKNPPHSKNPRASAYGKLMRKGFSSSTASQACGEWFG